MRDEISCQEIIVRAGDMAQSIKCLLKHENLSSGPISHIKSQGMAVYTYNPRTERVLGNNRRIPETYNPAALAESSNLQ